MNNMPMSGEMPFISLQQVCRQYSSGAGGLQPTDLNLYSAQRVGLVGCSGAGKSTLLKLLLALEAADAGHILCQGEEIRPAPVHRLRWYRRLVQYVPQDAHASLNPRHRVVELITAPLRQLGPRQDWGIAAERALRQVELDESLLYVRAGQLSGGQAQRVALARAIALKPRFYWPMNRSAAWTCRCVSRSSPCSTRLLVSKIWACCLSPTIFHWLPPYVSARW